MTNPPKTVLVFLPTEKEAFMIGHFLISRNCADEVVFFFDREHYMSSMEKGVSELKLLHGEKVGQTASLDWSKFKTIVVPNLDVLPEKSDGSYAQMAKNIFGENYKDVQFNSDVFLFFGGNFRGLILANEFGKVHPQLRPKVRIISSIFKCLREVFFLIFFSFIVSLLGVREFCLFPWPKKYDRDRRGTKRGNRQGNWKVHF